MADTQDKPGSSGGGGPGADAARERAAKRDSILLCVVAGVMLALCVAATVFYYRYYSASAFETAALFECMALVYFLAFACLMGWAFVRSRRYIWREIILRALLYVKARLVFSPRRAVCHALVAALLALVVHWQLSLAARRSVLSDFATMWQAGYCQYPMPVSASGRCWAEIRAKLPRQILLSSELTGFEFEPWYLRYGCDGALQASVEKCAELGWPPAKVEEWLARAERAKSELEAQPARRLEDLEAALKDHAKLKVSKVNLRALVGGATGLQVIVATATGCPVQVEFTWEDDFRFVLEGNEVRMLRQRRPVGRLVYIVDADADAAMCFEAANQANVRALGRPSVSRSWFATWYGCLITLYLICLGIVAPFFYFTRKPRRPGARKDAANVPTGPNVCP
jgi:hypothetical protein